MAVGFGGTEGAKALQILVDWFLFLPEEWIMPKVENILTGSLDLIPSPLPSVKIQIIGWKVYSRGNRAKNSWVMSTNFFIFKSLSTRPSNVLPLHLK